MERLGKNHGSYFGEQIDIQRICTASANAARLHGWQVEGYYRWKELP